jgi:hypothetical protein
VGCIVNCRQFEKKQGAAVAARPFLGREVPA